MSVDLRSRMNSGSASLISAGAGAARSHKYSFWSAAPEVQGSQRM